MFFGALVSGGIASDLLAPGRVEFLLSLPVRRRELLLGTYLGVLALAVVTTALGVAGATAIIYAKAGVLTVAPFAGAATAVCAFAPIYAVMLLATVLVRNSIFAIFSGMGLYVAGLVASFRDTIEALLEPGITRWLFQVLAGLVPKFALLGRFAMNQALTRVDKPVEPLPLFGTAGLITAGTLLLAMFFFTAKDY